MARVVGAQLHRFVEQHRHAVERSLFPLLLAQLHLTTSFANHNSCSQYAHAPIIDTTHTQRAMVDLATSAQLKIWQLIHFKACQSCLPCELLRTHSHVHRLLTCN